MLSGHVVWRHGLGRMNEVRTEKSGMGVMKHERPWELVRKIGMECVDEADVLVALANAPSHGVGMEIERALTRHERGLRPMNVICLVEKDRMDKVAWMLRGSFIYEGWKVRNYSIKIL